MLIGVFVDEGDYVVSLASTGVVVGVELVLAEHLDARRALNVILSHQASFRHQIDDTELHLFVLYTLIVSSLIELFF